MQQRVLAGVDAVAQAAALADLGEQPGAHAAAEHADRAPRLEVVGMAIGHARVGHADLRLLRIVRQVLVAARLGRLGDRIGRAGGPIAKQLAHQVLQLLPIDAAGDAENRAVGPIAAVEVGADVVDRGRLDRLFVALSRPAPGLGIVPPPQLDHHLLRRLVLHGPKLLEHRQAARLPTGPRASAAAAAGRHRWPASSAGSRPRVAPL